MSPELMTKESAREKVKELLLLIPNFVKLLYRLVGDKSVSTQEKALLLGTVAYVISPLDFLPDAIPFLGQIDDLLLVALILKRFMNSIDRSVLLAYWDGKDDLLLTIDKILGFTGIFLPRGVYNKIVKKSKEETIDMEYDVN
ncbi:MAG: hypothetical protein CVU90_07445 [Firmicutes bacterium HGW-Firmicutes-15]|nr:MAG: hypothetical protein CVU90_07445 [Firmicutes bacterium HGW-Firmicutes-15]